MLGNQFQKVGPIKAQTLYCTAEFWKREQPSHSTQYSKEIYDQGIGEAKTHNSFPTARWSTALRQYQA